jgi:hypothetical protein
MPDIRGAHELGAMQDQPLFDLPDYDALTPEQQAKLDAMAQATGAEPDRRPVTAVFVVVIEDNNEVLATPDTTVLDQVAPRRDATIADMQWGTAKVGADIHASSVGSVVQMFMAQTAQQIKHIQDTEKIRSKLKLP